MSCIVLCLGLMAVVLTAAQKVAMELNDFLLHCLIQIL